MRSVTRMTAAAALAALMASVAGAQGTSPTDQLILNTAVQLEKAAASGRASPADQRKLKEASEFLRDLVRGSKKSDNHKLLDFNDDPGAFRGKTLTFEMQVSEPASDGLREVPKDKAQVVLTARAGMPAASVRVVVDYADIVDKVANAHQGDRVVVTFDCLAGSLKNGNVAKSITRP